MKAGDLIKVRFWNGELIWARITNISKLGAIDAVLDNEPVNSPLRQGDPVSCGRDEVIDHVAV